MLEKNHRVRACSVRVQRPHFFSVFVSQFFILSVSMRMPLFVSLRARFLISTHIQLRDFDFGMYTNRVGVHVSHVTLHARDEQKKTPTTSTSTHMAIHETDFRC